MKFSVRHTFDTDLDTYWQKVFFNPEYNRRLYQDILKFRTYEVQELRDAGGGAMVRRQKMEPGVDAPGAVKRVLGDRFHYLESGRFDPGTQRWRYEVVPSVLADKVTIKGEFWVEPRGDKKVERISEMEIVVKVFGVGGLIEGFVEKQMRDSYDEAARFTNQFIREQGL